MQGAVEEESGVEGGSIFGKAMFSGQARKGRGKPTNAEPVKY
jgi:hypothetical protein